MFREHASLPEDKVSSITGLAIRNTLQLSGECGIECMEYGRCVGETDATHKVHVLDGRRWHAEGLAASAR